MGGGGGSPPLADYKDINISYGNEYTRPEQSLTTGLATAKSERESQ